MARAWRRLATPRERITILALPSRLRHGRRGLVPVRSRAGERQPRGLRVADGARAGVRDPDDLSRSRASARDGFAAAAAPARHLRRRPPGQLHARLPDPAGTRDARHRVPVDRIRRAGGDPLVRPRRPARVPRAARRHPCGDGRLPRRRGRDGVAAIGRPSAAGGAQGGTRRHPSGRPRGDRIALLRSRTVRSPAAPCRAVHVESVLRIHARGAVAVLRERLFRPLCSPRRRSSSSAPCTRRSGGRFLRTSGSRALCPEPLVHRSGEPRNGPRPFWPFSPTGCQWRPPERPEGFADQGAVGRRRRSVSCRASSKTAL